MAFTTEVFLFRFAPGLHQLSRLCLTGTGPYQAQVWAPIRSCVGKIMWIVVWHLMPP